MNRKEFIKTCGLVCVSGTALTSLLQSCANTNYVAQHALTNNQIIIKKSEFVKTEKGKLTERKYILLKSDKYNFPICIYKIKEEKYSALLMQCTHNSCELKPQGDYLICPCHGSEFTNQGIVQNPPAEQNLHSFKITTDNENIYMQF